MSIRTTDLREAIERLPDGATLMIQNLPWDDYEGLLEDLRGHPRLRVSYDSGRLEVMSPLQEHEVFVRFIDRMVYAYCEELDLKLESFGASTWKRRSLKKGAEPDACYYVEKAALVFGKRKFDLEFDPPPDIIVEIDITNESRSKFPIYAAVGIPEIWCYDGRVFQFYERTGNFFAEIACSRFLPGLTNSLMVETIESSNSLGQTEALKIFRQRIRQEKRGQ